MGSAHRFLFVSYARDDLPRVQPFVDALKEELSFRAVPIDLWMDVSDLQPGERWNVKISQVLESSVGFLFFLSPRSLKSDWVRREIQVAVSALDRLIIPVILHQNLDLPPFLATRQWLDLSGHPTEAQIAEAASEIADVTENYLRSSPAPEAIVSDAEAPAIAAEIAQELRETGRPSTDEAQQNAVFVVHGHDHAALATIEDFLSSIGVASVVLSREKGSSQSLFQKFMAVANDAQFAVVLLEADDYGASREQYESDGVADRALQFRARQNVIMELGFFYGRLGWENVLVVQIRPDKVFPNFERPSDLDGVLFDSMADEAWQASLTGKLREAGFDVQTTA